MSAGFTTLRKAAIFTARKPSHHITEPSSIREEVAAIRDFGNAQTMPTAAQVTHPSFLR
jgi:hypothetical protein